MMCRSVRIEGQERKTRDDMGRNSRSLQTSAIYSTKTQSGPTFLPISSQSSPFPYNIQRIKVMIKPNAQSRDGSVRVELTKEQRVICRFQIKEGDDALIRLDAAG